MEGSMTPNLSAHAKLNILGNDWVCVRGYRRSGNECVPVRLPANAELNILGNDWKCLYGIDKSEMNSCRWPGCGRKMNPRTESPPPAALTRTLSSC
jgi:hypothetical protein